MHLRAATVFFDSNFREYLSLGIALYLYPIIYQIYSNNNEA